MKPKFPSRQTHIPTWSGRSSTPSRSPPRRSPGLTAPSTAWTTTAPASGACPSASPSRHENMRMNHSGWGEAPDEPLVSTFFGSRGRSPHQFLFNRLAKALQRVVPAFFALLLLALPAVVQAQFEYQTNNGTITITGYTGPGGAVTIPDTTNGLPVTSIGDNAFAQSRRLTSVVIPDSVTRIGYRGFYDCTNLTSMTIGNNVNSIGNEAFEGSGLTSVMIPNSVTIIGDEVFESCTTLTNVTIPTTSTCPACLCTARRRRRAPIPRTRPLSKTGGTATRTSCAASRPAPGFCGPPRFSSR